MLKKCLDAICALLHEVCPTVGRIYINREPEKFVRPSFYVGLRDDQASRRDKQSWGATMTWMIIYQAAEDKAGDTDAADQITVIDSIQAALMNAGQLIADGAVYNVQAVAAGPYEGDVQLTVTLTAAESRVG